MSNYKQECIDKAQAVRMETQAIANAMGVDVRWPEPGEHPQPVAYIMNGNCEIMARPIWNKPDRLHLLAVKWPTYTDSDGNTQRTWPSTLSEVCPGITAARSRPPEAIARQIETRLMPEYHRIYGLLEEYAASNQRYQGREGRAVAALWEACQEAPRAGRKPYFIRNLPGDSVSIEYRSPGSVKIELTAADMVKVIAALRTTRAAS